MLNQFNPYFQFSVAPMMDCTDRHDRYFLRLISPHVLLYTEMITTGAIIYGGKSNHYQKFLAFDPAEHPIALQLGGNDPGHLAECAKIAADFNYDEINLNVGCPSNRVKSGQFGACLMLQPNLVADCVAAMRDAVNIPVSVKCRIGVDDHDSYQDLYSFVQTISQTGCEIFIVHARKAWLNGLSPKQNREIPPLQYDVVKRLKQDFPELTIILNGGIRSIDDIDAHLSDVDGLMIGREAYYNPYFLSEIENQYFSHPQPSRLEIIEKFIPYIQDQLQKNTKLSSITRHILGLFHQQRGAKQWRRYLSEHAYHPGAGVEVLRNALQLIIPSTLTSDEE